MRGQHLVQTTQKEGGWRGSAHDEEEKKRKEARPKDGAKEAFYTLVFLQSGSCNLLRFCRRKDQQ